MASTVQPTSDTHTQRLRILLRPEKDNQTDYDLILVPGCGTRRTEEWQILKEHDIIANSTARGRVLAFNNHVRIDEHFRWHLLLDEGMKLLDALCDIRRKREDTERPLLIMSHSLGGVIVKQALAIANQQHAKYYHILAAISGLVFLGTPHASRKAENMGKKTTVLLKGLPNDLSKQSLANIESTAHLLSDLARRFEDIQTRADILLVCETKETRLRDGNLFPRSKRAILVDEEFLAITNAPHSTTIRTNLDHNNLCDLVSKDNAAKDAVKKWFEVVICAGQQNIKGRIQAWKAGEVLVSDPSGKITTVSDGVSHLDLHDLSNASHDGLRTNSADYGSSDFEFDMIPLLKDFEVSRKRASLPCYMMGTFAKNDNFFGREDVLEVLDNALLPRTDMTASSESRHMKFLAVCGYPGLGKTEIALQFVHTRKHKFDAVFWIRADDKTKLEVDFCRIAVELELDDPTELQNPVVSRDLAKGWLANPKKLLDAQHDTVGQEEANWLIVFDNADDPDVLNDLKPLFGNGSILVTTRDVLAKTAFSAEPMGIDLTPFDISDTALLLTKLVGKRGTKAEAQKVAEILGGLPLAIAQMAGVIRKRYLQFSGFLRLYEDAKFHNDLFGQRLGALHETARGTISTILSVNDLPANARALLEVICFLDPDRIQKKLFASFGDAKNDLPEFPRGELYLIEALSELIQRALVYKPDKKEEISIHRLFRDSVKAKMLTESPDRPLRTFCAAVEMVSIAWPVATLDKFHTTDRWKECEELYPHVIAFQNYYENLYNEAGMESNLMLAKLLHSAGWWQHERGRFDIAKPLLILAQKICDGGSDQTQSTKDLLADVHYALGAVANETNDRIACTTHSQKLLSMRLEDLMLNGEPTIRLAVAYNESGIGLMMASDWKAAEEQFKAGIETYRSLPDFWNGMITLPMANLGLTYWLQERFDEAYDTLITCLKQREAIFGYNRDDSFRSGRVLHALGNVQSSRGNLPESEIYHQRALQRYQATIGNKHHRTADVCHKLAQHCIRRGDHKSARKLLGQALSVWNAVESAYRPEIARSTFLLSKSYTATDETSTAATLRNKAVDIRKSISHAQSKPDEELIEGDFDVLVTFWSM